MHVADDHCDGAAGKVLGAGRVAGENPDLEVPLDQAIDEKVPSLPVPPATRIMTGRRAETWSRTA